MRRRFLAGVTELQDAVSLSDLADAAESGEISRVLGALDFDAWVTSIGATPADLADKAKKDIGDEDDDTWSLLKDLQDTQTAAGEAAADELTQAGIEISFDASSPAAVNWILDHGADLVTGISDGSREAIRLTLADAYANGVAPRVTAQRIMTALGLNEQQGQAVIAYRASLEAGGMTGVDLEATAERYGRKLLTQRANVVAHHETMMAASQGQKQLWVQASDAGLIAKTRTQRVWIATEDETTCDVCDDMDGEETGIDEPWDTSEGPCDVPQDAHPGCRCSQGLVFKDQ